MSESIKTFPMASPPEDILSLLTRGAIKAMVTGDPTHESTSAKVKMNSSPDSTKTLFTVLTYPCSVMSMDRSDDLVVTISTDFYIYDGEHHVRVQILDNNALDAVFFLDRTYRYVMESNCLLIHVKSYVTSLANSKQDEPILFLTSIEMFDDDYMNSNSDSMTELFKEDVTATTHVSLIPPGSPFKSEDGRILGGKIVDFLTNIAPYMSFEALSGCQEGPVRKTPYPISPDEEDKRKRMKLDVIKAGGGSNRERIDAKYDETTTKLKRIASFLAKYQAMHTLVTVAQKENQEYHPEMAQLPASIRREMATIESFRISQVERHKASITANSGRAEPTSTTAKIMEQHQGILKDIYDHRIPLVNQSHELHIDMLHYCHNKLCHELLPETGTFRTKTVRVSTTNFVYNGPIHDIMSCLLLSLQSLRTRLIYLSYDRKSMPNHSPASPSNLRRTLSTTNAFFSGSPTSESNQSGQLRTKIRSIEQERVMATITYAAAACIGILDTHPYLDGNGRLARIVLNFILYHELHLPFPVPLFASPEQRVEYTKAICKTRQNIALLPVGNVPDDLLIEAYDNCGALQPMVDLILDRIYKSVTECNNQIVDKVSANSEEVDYSRAARNVREQALNTGSCEICFESPPNMSSLCCGTSYHVKCLAQWVKSNGTCPHCRFEIPPWEESIRDFSRITEAFRDIGVTADLDDFDDDTLEYGLRNVLEEFATLESNRSLSRITDAFRNIGISSDFVEYEDDTLEDGLRELLEEFANRQSGTGGTEQNGDANDTEPSGDENDTEQSDDENDTVATNVPPECLYCSNRSALDCTFKLCARCCRNDGRYCTRHS